MLRAADAGCAQCESPGIEDVERHDVPAADFVKDVLFGNAAIFEEDWRGRAAVDAHLVLFVSGLETGESALHDKGGELFAVYFRENHVDIRKASIGDPHLLAVEDVV